MKKMTAVLNDLWNDESGQGATEYILLLVVVVGLALVFKDKIMAQVKLEANKQLTAKMDFKDVDISIFRSFPNVSVGLDNFSITGTGRFEGIKLMQMQRFDVGLDIMSVIRGDKPMNIKKIWLTNPIIYVRVLEDGMFRRVG